MTDDETIQDALPPGWLAVESLDLDAQGVAHKADGKVVFIDGALPFEVVSANVNRKKDNWEKATLLTVKRESSQRVTPNCPHFGLHSGACGGCKMQHLHIGAQVAVKQRALEDALWHIGRVRAEQMLAPVNLAQVEGRTARIIEQLEKGAAPWRRPWGGKFRWPRNLTSLKPYRGINWMLTSMAGYESPWWLTYKQATERGAQVRKGEHGTPVFLWKTAKIRLGTAEKRRRAEQDGLKIRRDAKGEYAEAFMARTYTVFNASQVDGLDPKLTPTALVDGGPEDVQVAGRLPGRDVGQQRGVGVGSARRRERAVRGLQVAEFPRIVGREVHLVEPIRGGGVQRRQQLLVHGCRETVQRGRSVQREGAHDAPVGNQDHGFGRYRIGHRKVPPASPDAQRCVPGWRHSSTDRSANSRRCRGR